MNTQDKELFELCREVYERTGWGDTPDYVEERFVDGKLVATDVCENVGYEEDNEVFGGVQRKHFPLYTSDYLLEKLVPFKTEAMGSRGDMMPVNAFVFVRRESGNEYRAGYRYNLNGSKYSNGIYADTPLKALLKLTIALHEAGELK